MNPLHRLRNFLSDYCHFADNAILDPISFWVAGTYIFDSFDSYPYMVITARVKRAGKTRLSELVGFSANMPFAVAGATAPALYRKIRDDKPTIIWDEAESLSSEASGLVRQFLNVGYRKGQTIPRVGQNGVTEWPTYCPKCFILIGDVYDTLRDRSIIVQMQRSEPKKRFSYETCKEEGLIIGDELRKLCDSKIEEIIAAYNEENIPFLTDRDEEIWRPIFAMAKVLDPQAYTSMRRVAVDMSADKTNPHRFSESAQAEQKSQEDEYAFRLLKDMLIITEGKKSVSNVDAVELLKAIDIAPWRKYLGDGITKHKIAELMMIFGVRTRICRSGEMVFRAYTRKDIIEAIRKAGVK